jgi:hypothetical protein
MMWNDAVPRNSNIGPTFLKVTEALGGLTRSEARRVLRATWISLGLDEADPVESPAAVPSAPEQTGTTQEEKSDG